MCLGCRYTLVVWKSSCKNNNTFQENQSPRDPVQPFGTYRVPGLGDGQKHLFQYDLVSVQVKRRY